MREKIDKELRQGDIAAEIFGERDRQDEKFGEQNHPDTLETITGASFACEMAKRQCAADIKNGRVNWRNILDEEVCEAFEQASTEDDIKLREELVQVAAVAMNWIECIDRRKK